MKTDDLIRALAADATPEAGLAGRALLALVPALLLALVVVVGIMGVRADLAFAMVTPAPAFRWVLTGALAVVALRLALTLARPGAQARLWPLGAVLALALGVLIWGYITTPEGGRAMALQGKTIWVCLLLIPALSVAPVAALFWALRRGATTAPALMGAVVGLAGSGAAAWVYALQCTENSPLFYVTWYGLAILIVAAVSSVIGARVLRW